MNSILKPLNDFAWRMNTSFDAQLLQTKIGIWIIGLTFLLFLMPFLGAFALFVVVLVILSIRLPYNLGLLTPP